MLTNCRLCNPKAWITALLLGGSALEAADPLAEGSDVYNMVCVMCHTDGSASEMAPALKGSKLLEGKPNDLILSILQGRAGVTSPSALMPPADWLTDEQIAAVSQYVRTKFGRNSGPVTSTDVAKIRAKSD